MVSNLSALILVALSTALFAFTGCGRYVRHGNPTPPCSAGRDEKAGSDPATIIWETDEFRISAFDSPEMGFLYPIQTTENCVIGDYIVSERFVELRPGEVSVSYAYKSQGWSPMVGVEYTPGVLTFLAESGHTYYISRGLCAVVVEDEATGGEIARRKLEKGWLFCP